MKRNKRAVALADHRDEMAKGALCEECPFFGCGQGPVPSEIKANPRLMIVGQEPGKREIEQGAPFVGPSGRELDKALDAAGFNRSQVSIVNAVNCRSPDKGGLKVLIKQLNAKHKKNVNAWKKRVSELKKKKVPKDKLPKAPPKPLSPFEACAPRLRAELRATSAKSIMALGGAAHEAVASFYNLKIGKPKKAEKIDPNQLRIASINNQQGHPYKLPDGKYYSCSMHPAWAMREAPTFKHIIREQIGLACRLSIRGYEWKEPDYILSPTVGDVLGFIKEAREVGNPIYCDIETDSLKFNAKIRCIGYGFTRPNGKRHILVFPIRRKNKTLFWKGRCTKEQFKVMKTGLRDLLDDLPSVYHNGAFDTRHMRRTGYLSVGGDHDFKAWEDTMVLFKNTREVDAPKSLAFTSGRFAEIELWKEEIDLKSTASEKDAKLWLYNGRDIETTALTYHGVQGWIARDRTRRQNEIDRKVLPICRNMTELGVPVHRPTLEKYSKMLHKDLTSRVADLTKRVGKEVNFGSGPQLAKLLFEDWGNTPVINTDKFKFKPGDSPATSIPALMALQDAGCDKRTFEFIDKLIEFKAAKELLTSFVDNMLYRKVKEGREPLSWFPTEHEDYFTQHPNWVLHQTPTARMACRNRNWQNVPKRAANNMNLRTMVQAIPGTVFVTADFEQLEARLIAGHLPDPLMMEAFHNGHDIHTLNYASLVTDNEDDLWKTYHQLMTWKRGEYSTAKHPAKFWQGVVTAKRLIAKVFCFAMFYGATLETMHKHMVSARDKATQKRMFPGHTWEDSEKFFENFNRLHGCAKKWQREVDAKVWRRGWVATAHSGRKRWFPGGYAKKNAPPNHEIQGTAADFANEALIELAHFVGHRRDDPRTGLFIQVHDEIGAIVRREDALKTKKAFEEAMEFTFKGVRIYAEAEIQDIWTGPDISDKL